MEPIINVKNLHYSVPRYKKILEGLSFNILPGEFIGLLGKNGVGKTTLIDILMGYRNIESGQVQVFGENPQYRSKQMAQKVAYLSQETKLPSFYSLQEILQYHQAFYPKYSIEKETRLLDLLEIDKKQKMGGLSAGQSKKVQIVMGLSSGAELILIDEITAFLDPKSRFNFFSELKNHMEDKKNSIILATNITEDLENRVDKVLFLTGNEIQFTEGKNLNDLFKDVV